MTRPTIPGGRMTMAKARQRWEAVRVAAQAGDPQAMADAVSRFQSIAETFFMHAPTGAAIEEKADD